MARDDLEARLKRLEAACDAAFGHLTAHRFALKVVLECLSAEGCADVLERLEARERELAAEHGDADATVAALRAIITSLELSRADDLPWERWRRGG